MIHFNESWPAPNPAHALTFDETELAGLDGTLRTVDRITLPYTEAGQRYWGMGYWISDRSHEFADYCRLRRDRYEAGGVTSLPSIPDMWKEFYT